jgi:hypothetical protein
MAMLPYTTPPILPTSKEDCAEIEGAYNLCVKSKLAIGKGCIFDRK